MKLLQKTFPLEVQIDTFLSIQSLKEYVNIYSVTPTPVYQNNLLGTNIQSMCLGCDFNAEIQEMMELEKLEYTRYQLTIVSLISILAALVVLVSVKSYRPQK